MPNRHPAHRRKNMQRYGGANGKQKVLRRAANDVASSKQDTDCRGESPSSPECPSPGAPASRPKE
jgi:hypothetical protein